MPAISAVTVFCASSSAIDATYLELARQTGRGFAERGWELVYGGGRIGMMGECADACLNAGGRVLGVITSWLVGYEVAHLGVSDLQVVETMHERKQIMFERADGYLVLPGGIGTADEMFEAISWKQLQLHDKPIVLLDHDGFFQPLMAYLERACELRFIRRAHMGLFTLAATLDEAFDQLENYVSPEPEPDKWWLDQAERT